MDKRKEKISARIMHWLFFPEFAGEKEKFELLESDILLKQYKTSLQAFFDSMRSFSDSDLMVINLDAALRHEQEEPGNNSKVLTLIRDNTSAFHSAACLVYARDPEPVREFFHDHPVVQVHSCDDFNRKRDFVGNFLSLIRPPGSKERVFRSSMRIQLYPQTIYKVSCSRPDKPDAVFEGYARDISKNGVGVILYHKRLIPLFAINDVISVSITFPKTVMELKLAMVRRISLEEQLFGIEFDLRDHSAISRKHAEEFYSHYVEWIKAIYREWEHTGEERRSEI